MKKLKNNGDYQNLGRFYLFNNLWGGEHENGTQTSTLRVTDNSTIAWETEWNWTGSPDTIKSYVALVWGWHWGWKVEASGLPVLVDSIECLPSIWKFSYCPWGDGGVNISYDIWFSKVPDIDNSNPCAEIMIWLYKTEGITPIGRLKSSFPLHGARWELWEGPHPVEGWPVYSFIRIGNVTEADLDLNCFFKRVFSPGEVEPVYLISVEAGIEVFTGRGRLETFEYKVQV